MTHIEAGQKAVLKALDKIGSIPIKAFAADTFKEEVYSTFTPLGEDYDVTFLVDLLNYFPMDRVRISTGAYDQYLYDLQKTVVDNYEKGNYQVSYFYAHLIFMSYIYYSVEMAYSILPDKVKDQYTMISAYSGSAKPNIENHTNTYSFSKIPEKEIFKVFYAIGMDVQYIQQLSSYVKDRDDYAHATGQGNISLEALQKNIETIKRNMDTVHALFRSHLKEGYIKFLLSTYSRPYSETVDNIADYVMDEALSLKDIEELSSLGISNIRNENEDVKTNYRFIKKVHCAFIEYSIEYFGIEPPNNYSDLCDEAFLHYKYANRADEYVENELGISAYTCEKDGGTFPVFECVDCDEKQLVYDATQNKYHCFACDEGFSGDELCFCSECGTIMRAGEIDLCSDCIARKMED